MNPQFATEFVDLRDRLARLAAGQVGQIMAPVEWLRSTAHLLALWRQALARLEAEVDAAEKRRRAAEARLEELRGRPAPLPGGREFAAMVAEVRRCEVELDQARALEAEARGLRPERDLVAEFRRNAPSLLAPVLARAAAVTGRRAADTQDTMRAAAGALLSIVEESTEAHRIAAELAGRAVPAPVVTLSGRDTLERIARGESLALSAPAATDAARG